MSPEGQETASLWAAVRRWAGAGRRRRAELEARIAFQLQCLPHYYMPGIGAGEFVGTGEELVRLLRRVGGLRRDDRVLDLGCGLARVGIPLQRVLTSGSYDGVDVVEGIIHWNGVNITGVAPNFRFHLVDASSSVYNADGGQPASAATLPFADQRFTLAFAFSLFSHLEAEGTRRYLAELARVLSPRGRAILTFFILDEGARRRAEEGLADISLPHSWEHGLLHDRERPEEAVAYDEEWLLAQVEEAGLRPVGPIRWGRWSGRSKGLSYQDVLVLRRE